MPYNLTPENARKLDTLTPEKRTRALLCPWETDCPSGPNSRTELVSNCRTVPQPATQFRSGPGWKGNARGRPRGDGLTKLLLEVLAMDAGQGDGRTVAEWLVDEMIALAMKGNTTMLREIWNRIDGKVPDKVALLGAEGDEGAIQFIYGMADLAEPA